MDEEFIQKFNYKFFILPKEYRQGILGLKFFDTDFFYPNPQLKKFYEAFGSKNYSVTGMSRDMLTNNFEIIYKHFKGIYDHRNHSVQNPYNFKDVINFIFDDESDSYSVFYRDKSINKVIILRDCGGHPAFFSYDVIYLSHSNKRKFKCYTIDLRTEERIHFTYPPGFFL